MTNGMITYINGRKLWTFYALFLSGCLTLAYESYGLTLLGDSVIFLCLLFIANGFHAKKPLHILENALLVTVGYILAWMIKNSSEISYAEAPSISEFLRLALVSTTSTFLLGIVFSLVGYLMAYFYRKKYSREKSTKTLQVKN